MRDYAALAAASRAAQGLPPTVEDPEALRQLARIFVKHSSPAAATGPVGDEATVAAKRERARRSLTRVSDEAAA